jgi:hypothetical protein
MTRHRDRHRSPGRPAQRAGQSASTALRTGARRSTTVIASMREVHTESPMRAIKTERPPIGLSGRTGKARQSRYKRRTRHTYK